MRKLALFIVAALLGPAGPAMAGVESVGTTGANFLKIPPQARAASMGEAFVALSDDESSLTYNPSGSARMLQDQISATHIEWFQGLHLENLGGVVSLGPLGSVGAAIDWLQVDSLVRTERIANTSDPLANYEETGTFSPHDADLTFSYARPFGDKLNLGASLQILQQNIDTSNGWAGSLNLGAQYLQLFKGVDLGLVVSNLGTSIAVGSTAYSLPLAVTGGALYHLPTLPVVITADAGLPVDDVIDWGLGAETWIYDILALRLGYHGGFINAPTAGAGFRLVGFELDYAWVPYDELGQTHRLTVSYNFGTPPIGLGLERPLIGPIGDADKRQTAWLPKLQNPALVKRWTLSIIDATGHVVATQSGSGPVPTRLPWSGRDDSGRPLPDQLVTASLDAEFQGGIISSAKGPAVELDSLPPRLAFDVTPKIHRPDGSGAILIPAHFSLAAWDKHGIGGWTMEIRKKTGELFRSYNGAGAPPAEIVWDGNDEQGKPVDSGSVYICRLFARDTLGNRSESDPLAQVVLLKEVHFSMSSDALFDIGKADVRISAYQQMKEMKVQIMSYLSQGGVVEIVGHTDNVPVHASVYGSNEALSLARAQAVVKFFVNLLGMDPKIFKPVGMGPAQPITTNDTPEGREKNRRVDILIHGTAYQ
jgi:outer membrane protein OmpA-like peptidoglycan-associated protein